MTCVYPLKPRKDSSIHVFFSFTHQSLRRGRSDFKACLLSSNSWYKNPLCMQATSELLEAVSHPTHHVTMDLIIAEPRLTRKVTSGSIIGKSREILHAIPDAQVGGRSWHADQGRPRARPSRAARGSARHPGRRVPPNAIATASSKLDRSER